MMMMMMMIWWWWWSLVPYSFFLSFSDTESVFLVCLFSLLLPFLWYFLYFCVTISVFYNCTMSLNGDFSLNHMIYTITTSFVCSRFCTFHCEFSAMTVISFLIFFNNFQKLVWFGKDRIETHSIRICPC